jgi:Subtilase family
LKNSRYSRLLECANLVQFGLDGDGGPVRENLGTSLPVATCMLSPALAYESGTSLAAPRAAHKLALLLGDLRSVNASYLTAPLLRAFIVNSAQYPHDGDFPSLIKSLNGSDPKHWLNILGYGVPDGIRATDYDRYSAIFYYQGKISTNAIAYFSIPVPKVLCLADRGKKRLTVTVAFAPEVQRWGLEEYLGTHLKWKLYRGDVKAEDVVKAMSFEEESEKKKQDPGSAAEDDKDAKGPNDMKGEIGINLRSRGTVQHDIFEWTTHKESYSECSYTLAIAAFERWNRTTTAAPVPFAVVVRLEDLTRSAEVYAEVSNLLVEAEGRVGT